MPFDRQNFTVPYAGDVLWPTTYAAACLAMLFGDWPLGILLGLISYLCYNAKRWLHS